MYDVLMIGGGAVGLSIAYELAGRGRRVHVVERGELGGESSWAGAGIVPPAREDRSDAPLVQLAGLSARLHVDWAERLRRDTGIDNGYRVTGALYLSDGPTTHAKMDGELAPFRAQQIPCEALTSARLGEIEPALAGALDDGRLTTGFHVAAEAQLRNPRHVRTLVAACTARGVTFTTGAPVEEFVVRNGRLVEVRTPHGPMAAEQYCLTTGAWSGRVGEQLGLQLRVKPIRGQIALVNPPRPVIRGIVYVGRKYFVARDDGRVLVGSTEEDVGFDKSTTAAVVRDLLDFAVRLAPALQEARVEQTWAGLRPHSADDRPYLGQAPNLTNVFVAAGHYRWGLALSPGTAVVMTQLIHGEPTSVDLAPFAVGRSS
ncbi:MAG: glycine oxidase ThiO [Pirellulales bacterium]